MGTFTPGSQILIYFWWEGGGTTILNTALTMNMGYE